MTSFKNISKIVKTLLKNNFSNYTNKIHSISFKKCETSKLVSGTAYRQKCFSHSSTSSSTKANESNTSPSANNSLTLGKSKRLMRLIYSRVHPDLFTNFAQARVSL